MHEIPNELSLKIVSKLDIDTRRLLNIYSKIKVPIELQCKLTQVMKKIKLYKKSSCVELGPLRKVTSGDGFFLPMYVLTRTNDYEWIANDPYIFLGVSYNLIYTSNEIRSSDEGTNVLEYFNVDEKKPKIYRRY